MKFQVRMVEFSGSEEFVQGFGMTWDSVVVEAGDDERIVDVQATSKPGGRFNTEVPVVRVWFMAPMFTEATAKRWHQGVGS